MYILDDRQFGSRLNWMREFDLRILLRTDMTRSLRHLWPGWKHLPPDNTLFLIPGNGARDVAKDLRPLLEGWSTTCLVATRHWVPGDAPRASVNRVYPKGFLLEFTDVVVIDDVVASGATIQAIKRVNEPWMPGTCWHILTWVRQRSSDVTGFASIFASVEVGEKNGRRPPINSLSTLLDRPDVAESYATRNFAGRASTFLDQLRRS